MLHGEEEQKATHTGEFQELSWRLVLKLSDALTLSQQEVLVNDFGNFAQKNKLGLGRNHDGFFVVSLSNRSRPTDEEQDLLKRWLLNNEIEQTSDTYDQFCDAWLIMLLADPVNEAFDEFFS